MTTKMPLDYRVAVDLDLMQQVGDALTRMREGMLENKGPLTPDRRANLFDALWSLNPDGSE